MGYVWKGRREGKVKQSRGDYKGGREGRGNGGGVKKERDGCGDKREGNREGNKGERSK